MHPSKDQSSEVNCLFCFVFVFIVWSRLMGQVWPAAMWCGVKIAFIHHPSTSSEVASTLSISSIMLVSTPLPTVSSWHSQSSLSSGVLTSMPLDPLACGSLPVTQVLPGYLHQLSIPFYLLGWSHLT